MCAVQPSPDPDWTAPPDADAWIDDEILIACAWLESLADPRSWPARRGRTEADYREAMAARARGEDRRLFDPADTAAWYLFQGRAYAQDRRHLVIEEAGRIAPFLTRIGADLANLLTIPGAEDVGRRLMNGDRSQPDDGIYELCVALAWQRQGWAVAFVPATPRRRTHDIDAEKGRRRWAVECKRMLRSPYHLAEIERGKDLAAPVHRLALAASRSVAMTVKFLVEPASLPDDYLAVRAAAFLADPESFAWSDEASVGFIHDIDFSLVNKIMEVDDVYFGGSRMIELLLGEYDHDYDHTMVGKWRPNTERPAWAAALYQASIISWKVTASRSVRFKAKHFRQIVAKAAGQLPGDRPGVVHVGVESWAGSAADRLRHLLNHAEMRSFDAAGSRLRWVYGNYFAPELTTRHNESAATEETMVPYKVGRHSVSEPLPGHTIIVAQEATREGMHWDGFS